MKKLLLTTALAALLPASVAWGGVNPPATVPATSTPGHFTFLLGVGVEFGDTQPDVGVTGKLLLAPVTGVVAGGGATYFPSSGQVGLDLSAGLNLSGLAALGGYDFVTQKPQVSVGFAPTFNTLTCPSGYNFNGTDCSSALNASDRRVKRDVKHIATLNDGVKLYSFRYAWSETVYVGVMAQDLLEDPRFRYAVSTGEDGFYVVDYEQLDLVMVTLEEWNAHGLDAMVLGARPAAFEAGLAA